MTRRSSLSRKLRRAVAQRAGFLCEYCHLRQDLCPESFEIDHIIPRAVEGPTILENLCLACPVCNNAKASQLEASDSASGRRVRLFHPRLQDWKRHFRWSGDYEKIIGKTAVGRATVAALEMNRPRVVQIRLLWAAMGLHPPR
jgi:hypothetical protein